MADTNTVVSGLLWCGAPRKVLDLARGGTISLFTRAALLAELEDVLNRDKFKARLQLAGTTAHELVLRYSALARLVEPFSIEPVVLDDVDDDAVLSCAVAAYDHFWGQSFAEAAILPKDRDSLTGSIARPGGGIGVEASASDYGSLISPHDHH